MPIEETLNQKFKEALRAKDGKTLDVIRMVKTEYKRAMTAEGYKGEGGDELWGEVIQSYVKKLKKAVPEYEEGGEKGREMIEKLNFEIEFLKPYMPPLLDEAATEALVRETIANVSAAMREVMFATAWCFPMGTPH